MLLEDFAQQHVLFEFVECRHGECIKFNYECVVRHMLNAFNLTGVVHTTGDVSISFTIDSAPLHKGAMHVS